MSDCKLTNQIKYMLDMGAEIHQECAVRMPDGNVWKVLHDGSTEFLWKVSEPDAEKIQLKFTDIV